jgi:8-oxo-dGTP pyrophosphatase MutT (NUDIX family)
MSPPPAALPYTELLARNLRAARAVAKLHQSDVCQRMRDLGFASWQRSTMSLVERAKRKLTPEELLGLSVVFEISLDALVYAQGEQNVRLPGGQEVTLPAARYGVSVHPSGSVWSGNRSLLTRVSAQPVIAAIVTSRRGVLVGRRNDGVPPWTFIAGENRLNEPPEETAIREVKEEATLEIRAGEVIGERDHPMTGRRMIYIAAEPVHGTEIHVGDEAELAEVRWVSLAEADELLPGMFGPVREYLAREIGAG